MKNFFDKIINWLTEVFEPVADFFYTYRDNPLLWIGILVVGLSIFKLTFDVLNRNNGL